MYFIQKAGELDIFVNLIQRSENNILDTTMFLVTDLTSYAKMILLWVFFAFVRIFCIGFMQMEKY